MDVKHKMTSLYFSKIIKSFYRIPNVKIAKNPSLVLLHFNIYNVLTKSTQHR